MCLNKQCNIHTQGKYNEWIKETVYVILRKGLRDGTVMLLSNNKLNLFCKLFTIQKYCGACEDCTVLSSGTEIMLMVQMENQESIRRYWQRFA